MLFFLTGDPKFWGEELTGSTILSLLGTQGYGKTTLMARVAQEAAKVLSCCIVQSPYLVDPAVIAG